MTNEPYAARPERSVAAYGGGPIVREQIVLTAVYESQENVLEDGSRYVSHFATCPDSNQWRKG